MKKLLHTTLKGLFTTGLALFMMLPAMSQREKGGGIITQDQVRQITDIVKPIKDQLERQISGDSRYLAYVDDVKRVEASSSAKERNSLAAKIKEKYSSFFKDTWSALRVDEAGYQNKIRKVFPSDLASGIQFGDFLGFTMNSSSSSKSQALESGPDQCLDVCGIAAGEIISSSVLIAGASGSYGNCYLSTIAMAYSSSQALVGIAETNGYLRNGITIPGTFADDSRTLGVKLSFNLNQGATCIAALGVSYAETRVQTFASNESLVVFAPLIWMTSGSKIKTINENYVLLKKNVSLSKFWAMSKVFSILDGGNMGWSDISNIKWTICEQK
ncbi:MAG TPA: hypothetical protein VLJ68_14215 [Chitinophagaceae bacterium]|nr:hypothetical protein [Chitinophagaceae bacterium]